jgi:predicted HicB family RNase H-like nuclease
MTLLRYKGYSATVDIDLNVNVIYGRVQDIQTVIVFEAERVDEVQHAFEAAIDNYLDDCTESGIKPERPHSGNILIRTTPEVHRLVAEAAQRAGVTMNAWAEHALREATTTQPLMWSGDSVSA